MQSGECACGDAGGGVRQHPRHAGRRVLSLGAALGAALGVLLGGSQAAVGGHGDWRTVVGDRNGDGVVNVLDLAPRDVSPATEGVLERGSGGERIIAEVADGGLPSAPAGATFRVRFRLENSTTPLFGYSLGLSILPEPGAGGALEIDFEETGFFESQNLIVAGGAVLDPLFSVIIDDGTGGAFINANTIDGSTVLAEPGVNDVFAEVVVTSTAKTLGEFAFELIEITALSDGVGMPVPYEYEPLVIEVTVAPCSGADLAQPFQILDLNDLVEFAILFTAEDPRVDYAVPVGLFDLADVLTFVGFFLAGC